MNNTTRNRDYRWRPTPILVIVNFSENSTCVNGALDPTTGGVPCCSRIQADGRVASNLACASYMELLRLQVMHVVAPRASAMLQALEICVPCWGCCTGLACLGGTRPSPRQRPLLKMRVKDFFVLDRGLLLQSCRPPRCI